MSDLSDEELEILQRCHDEHGEVFSLKTRTAFVVFKCPTQAQLKRMKALVADDRKDANAKADVDVGLARDVVVHPDKDEFNKLIARRPMITARIASEALLVASDEETKEAKKFEGG